ncbi:MULTISPECIES: hypothetical protein [Lysobacter]|uniref:hypothetical protein n=1 Tax=Lysobacter TaxID=68 RepID=UPI001F23AD9C|nr:MULTISPECIES: hypothetical protein [Lysobacter]UJB19977.1 hypothetical protein L1A79_02470 [Lysobacter capsici]UJQ30908.1 hypothetical protein L2D09_12390 [Lysobacter gummosus]
MRSGSTTLAVLSLSIAVSFAFAGPSRAGGATQSGDDTKYAAPAVATASASASQALVAEYQVRDAKGERTLVLVRSADRIEYRMQGEPVELWRKTPDGIARLELFAKEQRSVSWSPGDLRTIGQMPQWPQLASLIDPELRTALKRDGQTKAFGTTAARYNGESAEGQPIALEWIEADALPAYYRTGKRKAKTGEPGLYELRLRKLERVSADAAFTATIDYRETDYADLGDMELDPFAANYVKQHGDHTH